MNSVSLAVVLCLLTAWSSLPVPAYAGKTPTEVGGFKLGTSIEEYEFISYRNYLKEVVIDQIPGFRKGTISYGVCDQPGKIIKIKLKYLDPSRSFFKKLMKQYTKQFGEPFEYSGDTFGIVKAWKWHFKDADGNKITMILQHNLKNPNEVTGNMVKLYMPDQVEAERKCFNKMCSQHNKDAFKKAEGPLNWDKSSWQLLIPH